MKKNIRKILLSSLILLTVTPGITPSVVNANSTVSQLAEDSVEEISAYTETALKFTHKGECEDGPWELNRNSDGSIYAYEWDTHCKNSNSETVYWMGLNKMIWSKEGKLSYQTVKLSNKFSKRFSSGDDVYETKQDKKGNLYVVYNGSYNGNDSATLITVLNKKGTILKDIVAEDVLKHYTDDSTLSIRDMHISGNKIVLLVYESSTWTTSVQVIDWKTKKRISSQKLDDMSKISIIGSYLYGVKYIKGTDAAADVYRLLKYSLDGTKELWNQKLPEGAMNIGDDEVYNKFEYDTVDNTIYVCNASGIYYADTSDKNGEFSLLLSANESTCISEYYTLVNLRVISDERFYLLYIAGYDDESPSDLTMYTLNK